MMNKILLALITVLLFASTSFAGCPGGGNFCAFWRTDYIGGDTTDLDGIPAATPTNGSIAFVVTTTEITMHRYDTTSGAAEYPPHVVAPDDAGNERWLLVKTMSNLGIVNKAGAATLTAQEMNKMVYMSAAGKITLPLVTIESWGCVVSTGANAVDVDPDDNDRMILNGTALADGIKITSASGAGDYLCYHGDSANGWTTWGRSGTWFGNGA